MEQFRQLGIIEPILKVIQEEKFEKPTSIQVKGIPLVLSGQDVIAESATGSGKTLTFGAGIIQKTNRREGVQALVVAPTRELAEQVGRALMNFSRYKPLQMTIVYGGVPIGPQIRNLQSADIVIGTPGRILDHIERGTLNLGRVNTLVLDEADHMLDMGFIDDVEKIIRQCPAKRQTLLFSATIPQDIAQLARKYMKNPVKVAGEGFVDPRKLKQVYYDVPDNLKFSLLTHLLKNEKSGLVMVFCNSRRNTDFVANNLRFAGLDSVAIHGGLTQSRRNSIMRKFHAKSTHVLVCTDVAARGLDIPGVSHVYNYDIPKDTKQYVHRIGRTARAGKEGKAVNIVASRDYENFTKVLEYHDIDVEQEEVPYVEKAKLGWIEKPRNDRGWHKHQGSDRSGGGRGYAQERRNDRGYGNTSRNDYSPPERRPKWGK